MTHWKLRKLDYKNFQHFNNKGYLQEGYPPVLQRVLIRLAKKNAIKVLHACDVLDKTYLAYCDKSCISNFDLQFTLTEYIIIFGPHIK